MFISFSHTLSRWATSRNILILLALWIGFQFILGYAGGFIEKESQGASVLDLAVGFSADEAYSQYLDKYSEAARSMYLKAACVDLVYPICYGLLFSLLISIGFNTTKLHILNLLPIIAVLFDYLENVGIFALLLSYPQKLYFMATWTSVFGSLKWLFAGFSILPMIASLAKIVIVKFLRK